MSEGYTLEDASGETVGIVVKQSGDRGFRFHAGVKAYDALDGHVFANPRAAQRAVREWKSRPKRSQLRTHLETVSWPAS